MKYNTLRCDAKKEGAASGGRVSALVTEWFFLREVS